MVSLQMFLEWETQRLLINNEENLQEYSQSTPIKYGKFDFNDTITSLSGKSPSSVIESANESENHNLSSSEKEILSDSPTKRKCIQSLCAEELSEEQPP